MKFLTVEMDNFIKERVLYEVKVNKLSPADAHDKAKQALKDLILRVYGAETKAIYIKDYGLKPDVALQVAVSDCKIKIETYFDTKAPKVGNNLTKLSGQMAFMMDMLVPRTRESTLLKLMLSYWRVTNLLRS